LSYLSFSGAAEFLDQVVTPFVFRDKPTPWAPFVFWVVSDYVTQDKLCREIWGEDNLEPCVCVVSGARQIGAPDHVWYSKG
jgi:hypothetical protein